MYDPYTSNHTIITVTAKKHDPQIWNLYVWAIYQHSHYHHSNRQKAWPPDLGPVCMTHIPALQQSTQLPKGRSPGTKLAVLLDCVQITLTPPPNLDNFYHSFLYVSISWNNIHIIWLLSFSRSRIGIFTWDGVRQETARPELLKPPLRKSKPWVSKYSCMFWILYLDLDNWKASLEKK